MTPAANSNCFNPSKGNIMNLVLAAQQARLAATRQHLHQRAALNEQRRVTCNQIARIMRRLGFPDATAAQADHGRRDVRATLEGEEILVGIFWGDTATMSFSMGILPPPRYRQVDGWLQLPNVAALPRVLRFILFPS